MSVNRFKNGVLQKIAGAVGDAVPLINNFFTNQPGKGAADANTVYTLKNEIDSVNDSLGEQPSFVYDENGQITGYTTKIGGADTVFPFKQGSLLKVDTYGADNNNSNGRTWLYFEVKGCNSFHYNATGQGNAYTGIVISKVDSSLPKTTQHLTHEHSYIVYKAINQNGSFDVDISDCDYIEVFMHFYGVGANSVVTLSDISFK